MRDLIKNNAVFYLFFIPVYVGCSFVVAPAPLAVGFLGVCWFTAKKRYDYVVLAFLLTLILANNRAPVFSSYETLRILFIGVLLILSVLIIFRDNGVDQRVIYFIPYFGVGLFSSFFFSPTMIYSVFKVISYLILVITIFALIKYLLQNPQFKLYEHLLLLIGISLGISLVGAFVYPSVFLDANRLKGVFGNPNPLALYCVLSFAFADHFRVENSNFTKRGILYLKGLILLALFLTGSRNGYVSLAMYITLSIFIFRGISGKSIAVLLGLSALIALTQIELLAKIFPFLGKLVRPDTIGTASGRSIVWPVAIDEIFRQPWLGGGFGYYSYYMKHFALSRGLQGVYWYGVWNTYLAILLDAGLIGLAAYFFFIYGVIRKSIRFIIVLPFLCMMAFTGIFEAWAVSSLNPITPFFILFFVVISKYGSKYENISTA